MRIRHDRPGFTLIELVVVIAIIGVVIVLLLSSVCRVTEASARAKCQNNLKQIGLAAHNYHSTNNCLPTGWLGPFPNTSLEATPETQMQAVGCLCLLLPFLEQQNLYSQFLRCAPSKDYFSIASTNTAWYNLPASDGLNMLTLATTKIPTFLCPSDTAEQRAKGCILWQWGPIDQAMNGTPQNFYIYKSDASASLGRTNYTGVGGLDQNFYQIGRSNAGGPPGSTWGQFDGIMTNRSQFTLKQLTEADGTSNMLMFGELLGDSDGSVDQQMGYSVSWMCGSYPTYAGTPTGDLPYPAGGARCYWAFGSRHNGVVQFCMADGAVRSIKKGVKPFDTDHFQDPTNPDCIFGYYAGWHDGMKLDSAFINN
jgi:prepilin-type N-terminal cleavage/methylation domain-containing protein/prepilin-type processing-associated H-X9-DG protein